MDNSLTRLLANNQADGDDEEVLPVAEEQPSAQTGTSSVQVSASREEEEQFLRRLRMVLRVILEKVVLDRRFRFFSAPPSETNFPGYYDQVRPHISVSILNLHVMMVPTSGKQNTFYGFSFLFCWREQVNQPMDLATLLWQLNEGCYPTLDHFFADFTLIKKSAQEYFGNPPATIKGTRMVNFANELEDIGALSLKLSFELLFGNQLQTIIFLPPPMPLGLQCASWLSRKSARKWLPSVPQSFAAGKRVAKKCVVLHDCLHRSDGWRCHFEA